MDSATAVLVLRWVIGVLSIGLGALQIYRGLRLMGIAFALYGLSQLVPGHIPRLVLTIGGLIAFVVYAYLSARPEPPTPKAG